MGSGTQIIWAESFEEEQKRVEHRWDREVPIEFFEVPAQDVPAGSITPGTLISIRTHSRLESSDLSSLRGVVSRSTGYDHLEPLRGVLPCAYLPEYATEAVGEHNLAVTMSLLRRLPRAHAASRRFHRGGLMGEELSEFTVGVLGVGRIGKATSRRFMDLGASVRGCDIEPDPSWAASRPFEYVALEELFEGCRLIVLCLPLTESTRGLVTRRRLGELSSGAYLVNCGRGEVVSNRDLLWALEEGPLRGAGLDVFNRESAVARRVRGDSPDGSAPSDGDPEVQAGVDLLNHSRVVATPHNAFNTDESLRRKVEQTLENLRCFLDEGHWETPIPDDTDA